MEFDSVEAIELQYARKLAETPEDGRLHVELEKTQKIAGFYKDREQATLRSAWEQDALREFPHATKDDLRGNTPEEIKAAASARHGAVQSAIDAAIAVREKEIEERIGRSAYGGSTSGGGTPITDASTPDAIREKGLSGFENRPTGFSTRTFKSGELNRDEIQRRQADHLTAVITRQAANQ